MVEITYYGHSSFLFSSDAELLSDPFIKKNKLATNVNIKELNPSHILLTHGHEDHVADAEEIGRQSGAQLIGIVEVINWFKNRGYPNSHSLNFGGWLRLTETSRIKLVQARHSSSMPDGSYGGEAGSYVIEMGDKTLFLAGDTGIHTDMKMYGEAFDFDLVILPIGGNYTMDPFDAIYAAKYLKCDQVVGCHYDTFPEITINKMEAVQLFKGHAVDLFLLDIGQKITI
jgi:L-ascorbate metabolism protein UlaG (beta-lactamase superfamily)